MTDELVICPKAEKCSYDECFHKKPHVKKSGSSPEYRVICDREGKCGGRTKCVPYEPRYSCTESLNRRQRHGCTGNATPSPEYCGECSCLKKVSDASHRTTGASKDDKPGTESSGQQNRGNSCGYFSCPHGKAGVNGAVIYHLSSAIQSEVKPMDTRSTWTLHTPVATLCACCVQGQNLEVRCCVLNVGDKDIIANPEKSASPAGTTKKPSSTGKNTGDDFKPDKDVRHTGSITRKKRSTSRPASGKSSLESHPCYSGCKGFEKSNNNDDPDWCKIKARYLQPSYLYWLQSHGCKKRKSERGNG